MRIGILTYHRSLNYGAVMQSASLAEQLSFRFPSAQVEIVDYVSARKNRYYKMITLYRGRESVLHIRERIEMYRAFQRGVAELPLSPQRLISDKVETFYEWLGDRYDILVAGSDEIWNYSPMGIPNPYFLSGNLSAKRFAYAASCNGLKVAAYDDVTREQKDYLRASFEKFEYIGVRDRQTEELVHAVYPEQVVYHNCDPSLLYRDLTGRDRSALIDKLERKYHFDPKKPTIAFMLSNYNGVFKREVMERIRERYGDQYQTVSIYSYNKYADIPYIADLTPQEWSILFGLFDLSISKYYHGILFSVLNHTPVIAVGANPSIGGLPNKIEDALGRMELQDFYFAADDVHKVNWDKLMAKVDECLNDPPVKRMVSGIDKESQSAEVFFENIGRALAPTSSADASGKKRLR